MHNLGLASNICKIVLNFFVTVCLQNLHSISNCVVTKYDPLSPSTCEREDCFFCSSGGGGIVGRAVLPTGWSARNVKKFDMKTVYQGDTGRNCYSRWLKRLAGLRNENEDNPLGKHCQIQHNGQKVTFRKICSRSFKTTYMRQFNKGVRTAGCSADICMNSKADFHQPSIVRVTITLENRHEE